jgi:two-component system sensor histidine kinase CpxA
LRSIFTKILLWALGTIALSLVGFAATSWLLDSLRPGRVDFIARTQALQLEGARRAYEEGGPDRLAAYLRRLDELFEAEHFLVDANGKDLVDGHDRSALLAQGSSPSRRGPPPRPVGGRFILTSPPDNGGSRLLIVVRPPFGPGIFLLYYLWILLVIVGLGYALAVHLARPLRGLRRAVERFGQGELSTRIGSTRRDEIGELSRAFDVMADRIKTLLSAERRLLQDVSHELRSPLARLKFAVELARTSEDRGAAMDRIKRDVDRLSTLVDELLQLTRAEGDPSARALEEVLLGSLLQALVEDCTLEANAKGCRLVLRAEGPCAVQGERELLRRAIENVLRNALRYAPERTTIEIDLQLCDGNAIIAVRDYGVGVPEQDLESIFEPFYRVEDDRSRTSGGVGLGLGIARRAVALHGGSIVARNVHPGLRVTIELPHAVNGPE